MGSRNSFNAQVNRFKIVGWHTKVACKAARRRNGYHKAGEKVLLLYRLDNGRTPCQLVSCEAAELDLRGGLHRMTSSYCLIQRPIKLSTTTCFNNRGNMSLRHSAIQTLKTLRSDSLRTPADEKPTQQHSSSAAQSEYTPAQHSSSTARSTGVQNYSLRERRREKKERVTILLYVVLQALHMTPG